MGFYRVERRDGEVLVYAGSEDFFLASLPLEQLRAFVKDSSMVVIVYPSGRRVYVGRAELERLLESVKNPS